MPSPIGHALSGAIVASLVYRLTDVRATGGGSGSRVGLDGVRLAGWAILAAVVPDADLLVATHRAAWHSLSAGVLAGLIAWLALRARGHAWAGTVAATCALAWATHVGLDWLGKDSSDPRGIMALWPWSRAYYESGLDWFTEVSRRYWRLDEFLWGNLRAVGREAVLLLPPAVAATWWARRRPQY